MDDYAQDMSLSLEYVQERIYFLEMNHSQDKSHQLSSLPPVRGAVRLRLRLVLCSSWLLWLRSAWSGQPPTPSPWQMLQFVPFLSITSEQLQIARGKLTYSETKPSIYNTQTTFNILVHNIVHIPFYLTYGFLQPFFYLSISCLSTELLYLRVKK
jgi:hypothetical protein